MVNCLGKNKTENRKEGPSYDAWLFWNITFKCNLACTYCNASDPRQLFKKIYNLGILNSANIIWFNSLNIIKRVFQTKRITELTILRSKLTPRAIAEINIPLLIGALDETKKIFKITFTGGEPFVIPNFEEACREITKKHYIGIHSNLTTSRILHFADTIDPDRVLFIHGSLHIKELERLNLLDKYIENFLLLRKKGFYVYARPVAYPSLAEEAGKWRLFFRQKSIEIEFDLFRGKYKWKQYPTSYTNDEMKIFGLGEKSKSPAMDVHGYIEKAFYQRGSVCNAGYNAGAVFPSGEIQPCFAVGKSIGNIYEKIEFERHLMQCPYMYCSCPLNFYDPYLFQKAIRFSCVEGESALS